MLTQFVALLSCGQSIFVQQRIYRRALAQALASLATLGTRTLSRRLGFLGQDQQDGSAAYKFSSRRRWDQEALFDALLPHMLAHCPGRYLPIALDDTRLPKTGQRIPGTFWQRDPLGPPFHVNLLWGLRFLPFSLLVPLHQQQDASARALPLRFSDVAPVQKPGKKASEQEQQRYRAAKKQQNLSRQALTRMAELRASVDAAGARDKTVLYVGDASFCHRTLYKAPRDRWERLCRCRRDLTLCFRAPAGSRRFYAADKFTPEQVRTNDAHDPWQTTKIYHGGPWREVRDKEVANVLWPGGAGQPFVRLFVVAPTPYRRTPTSRLYYRRPAFLLTTDLAASAQELLQAYFDRWPIEVNFREEKSTLGVGQAQVWSKQSVARQPAFMVASYSALLLAALQAYGAGRPRACEP